MADITAANPILGPPPSMAGAYSRQPAVGWAGGTERPRITTQPIQAVNHSPVALPTEKQPSKPFLSFPPSFPSSEKRHGSVPCIKVGASFPNDPICNQLYL